MHEPAQLPGHVRLGRGEVGGQLVQDLLRVAPVTNLDQSLQQTELLVILVLLLPIRLLVFVLVLGGGGHDVQPPDELLGVSDLLVRHPRDLGVIRSQQ